MSDFIYVIVDIGSRYIRAGIAGEELVHVTIANNGYLQSNTNPKYLELNDHSLDYQQRQIIWDNLSSTYKKLIRIFQNDTTHWINYDNEILIHAKLLEVMSYLPLNYSKCKMVILDGFSMDIKYMLSKIFLDKIGVKSVQFFSNSILSVVASNQSNGLVVELGWKGFTVTSIYDYRIIDVYEGVDGLSGENLHYKIVEQLIKLNSDLVEDIDLFDMIEEFIIGKDNQIRQLVNLDETVRSILRPVLDGINLVYERATTDMKPCISKSIIVDGGLSKLPNIKDYIINGVSFHGNCIYSLGAWHGGSIYFSTSILRRNRKSRKQEEITKDTIKEITNGDNVQLVKLTNIC